MVGINKGQVLFGIIAIVFAFFIFNLGIIMGENPVLYQLAFFAWPLAFFGLFVILLNFISNSGVSFSIRPPHRSLETVRVKKDLSHLSRLIIDSITDEEHIVHGEPSWTFRFTCISDWKFKNFPKSGNWIIKDERGNDISSTPLERYDGIASIE